MTWSFTPWKIYFTNRQQIIYLYLSMKLFFKFPLQSFYTCFHCCYMSTYNGIIIILRTL